MSDSEKSNPSERIQEAINAACLLGQRGSLTEAIEQLDQALELCQDTGETSSTLLALKASVHANKGAGLGDMERFADAIQNYDAAIAIYDQLLRTEPTPDLMRLRGVALMNKGWALVNLSRHKEGFACHNEALNTFRQLLDDGWEEMRPQVARGLYNCGEGYFRSGQLEEALTANNEAIKIWSSLGALCEEDLAYAVSSKADALAKLGRLKLALAAADEALRMLVRLSGTTENPKFASAIATTIQLRDTLRLRLGSHQI